MTRVQLAILLSIVLLPLTLVKHSFAQEPEIVNLRVIPRHAEPGQPVTVEVEGLPAPVLDGSAAACIELVDEQAQAVDSWPLEADDQAAKIEFEIGQHIKPGNYHLTLKICALFEPNVIQLEPQLDPLTSIPYVIEPRTGRFDEIEQKHSPDGQWVVVVNKTTGSLTLQGQRQETRLFPEGSSIGQVTWSPDSSRLLIERTYHYVDTQQGGYIASTQPIEIWQARFEVGRVLSPTLLFQSSQEDFKRDGSQQIVFGHWSPNSRYIIFWVGILSASILADGLPPAVLDTDTGLIYPIALDSSTVVSAQDLSPNNTSLINPHYQSWSPDSSRLTITAGGYRSAQINKWLNLFDVASGQVTTVISETEQIPGVVAWSPLGDSIAYAAVPAEQTGEAWADLMTFDNPAVAGRRIYLLDPITGRYRRLNQVETYQDAPVWSGDGLRLYYIQRDGVDLQLMVADPQTGQANPVPDVRQPIELDDPYRPTVGYYGQFDREELLEKIPETPPGAMAVGRVILGAGNPLPVSDLPLWVGDEPDDEIKRRTDENGAFTLTGVPQGLIKVRNSHLVFEVPVTSTTATVDLGLLRYPLIHPPVYYWWMAAPLPDPSVLLKQGQEIDFSVCHSEPTWQRPSQQTQQETVWSKRPFSNHSELWLRWWFERPAVIYNSEAQFEQSYPDGPNLDHLTVDWRYLLGLWNDPNLEFERSDVDLFVPQTGCAYDGQALNDLLSRRQIELWLLGYEAGRVQRLDKEQAGYNEAALCDPQASDCTERPGHHFAVHVKAAPGYQIIRFGGVEDVLAVHLIDEEGRELLELPEIQPNRW